MMDYEKLMHLIDHLDQSSVAYVDYETDTQHVILSKEVPQLNPKQEAAQVVSSAVESSNAPEVSASKADTADLTTAPEEKAGELVESPMVGVVYLQPGPDQDTYVTVGQQVEEGDTICIVEAMKLMNEIQAPRAGTVTEILVDNEAVVEFGQPLIRIN